jgi:hypothetical protein
MEEYKFLLASELKKRFNLPNKIIFSHLRWELLRNLSQRRFKKYDLLDLVYFEFLRYNLEERRLNVNTTYDEMSRIIDQHYKGIEKRRSVLRNMFRIMLIQSRLSKEEDGTLESNIVAQFSALHSKEPEKFNQLLKLVSELYFFMAQQFQVDYFSNLAIFYIIHPELYSKKES